MSNDNLTNKQFEFLMDLFIVLNSPKGEEINKNNILNELQNQIISTMTSYWDLVEENNKLKEKVNNLF